MTQSSTESYEDKSVKTSHKKEPQARFFFILTLSIRIFFDKLLIILTMIKMYFIIIHYVVSN